MTTYTASQIKTGQYDMNEVFGSVVPNPLPFRLVGFDETDVDGVYEAYGYCAESLEEARAMRWRCSGPVFGVFHLASSDGRTGTWDLIAF